MSFPRLTMICHPPGLAAIQCRVRPLPYDRGCSASKQQLRLFVQLTIGPSRHRQARSASAIINFGQMRFESSSPPPPPSSSSPGDATPKKFTVAKPKPPSIWFLLRSAIRNPVRNLTREMSGKGWKTLLRQYPVEAFWTVVMAFLVIGMVSWVAYIYFTIFYSRRVTSFPDPVAQALRRAIYYSDFAPDPKLALKYYNKAMELCKECRVDFFSDEFLGLRIHVACWLEKLGQYPRSIEVLEGLLSEIQRWADVMEKAVEDGTAPYYPSAPEVPWPSAQGGDKKKEDAYRAQLAAKKEGADAKAEAVDIYAEHKDRETIWGKRNRILLKALGISVKLGELYADEHVLETELAHERLTWAVETSLKEFHRRATEGLRPGEGEWVTKQEMGGAFEALAISHLGKYQAQLAVPLFFQALHLCQDPCHTAVIMNNLAAAFAQHPIEGPAATLLTNVSLPSASSTPESKNPAKESPATAEKPPMLPVEARAQFLEYADRWAKNANKIATQTKGGERTPECDEACAVSLYNLGDIAKMLGNTAEARRRFAQCLEMSKKLNFADGMKKADDGMRSLIKA